MDPLGGQVTTPIDEFGDFAALDPFFRIIEEGLEGFVDDGHFFDLLAEDVIFEYVVSVPGYPRRVEGRGGPWPCCTAATAATSSCGARTSRPFTGIVRRR
jgi:hypothetical protein